MYILNYVTEIIIHGTRNDLMKNNINRTIRLVNRFNSRYYYNIILKSL